MKYAGARAVTGVLLKAVKTSRVHTTRGSTYLTECSLNSLAFVAHILQEHTSIIAKGSWVTEVTPAQKIIECSPRFPTPRS